MGQLPGSDDYINFPEPIHLHLFTAALKLLAGAGHDRHTVNLRRVHPVLLGAIGFDERTNHLHRRLAA
ncbi:hypothetical protein D3C75_1074660 [compost metagenome]